MEKVLCDRCGKDTALPLLKIKEVDGIDFSIVRCKECDLVYMNPRFEAAEIAEFYKEDYLAFDDTKQIGQIIYAKEALTDILEFKRKGRLLDIGCAKGIFLAVARRFGFEVTGLEISQFASEFASSVLGIETFTGTVEDVALPEKSYDIITMFDVVEHYQHPKESMKIIKAALKDDGILVIDTPNIESIFSKFRGMMWGGFGRYHLYYFSNFTLTRLLEDCGFKPISSVSHKCEVISFDSLWRWGLISYRIYTWLEKTYVLSKVCSDIDVPIKKMYERKQYKEIRKIIDRQISDVLNRQVPVSAMLKTINRPANRILGRVYAGDAVRIIAKRKEFRESL